MNHNPIFKDDSFENIVRQKRRNNRKHRIDVMKELETGILEDRPQKERFSREFKKPKLKKVKDPLAKVEESNCLKGLVVEVHRRTCEVKIVDSDEIITAMYLATTSKTLREFPTVGDNVLLGRVNKDEDSGEGVGSQKYLVVRVLPRESSLSRPGPRDSFNRKLTLAANIDQVVIVASVKEPEFNYGFMDRFLLAANLCSLPFILVLTKIDLLDKGIDELDSKILDFMHIVDKVMLVSTKTGKGLDELHKELKGKKSVFSGQSGVGKSSLINALIPGLGLNTGEVRKKDGKGRHTTTSSSLVFLSDGGFVIDTPGIRSIGISNKEKDLDKETLAKIFPGFFKDDLFTCKYSNCLHISEPGCSVQKLLNMGKLSMARYESYLRILQSKD